MQGERMALSKSIRNWRIGLFFVVLGLAGSYFYYWIISRKFNPLTAEVAFWGQLGDYIGGIVNPIVAYAAFYWLTKSVTLQQEELAETRAELEKSATALQQQGHSARVSVRVAALTGLMSSIKDEIQILMSQLGHYRRESKVDKNLILADGSQLDYMAGRVYIQSLQDKFDARVIRHQSLEMELEHILRKYKLEEI